jgi:hypothetical protein
LLMAFVIGYSRVPLPPARMMPRMGAAYRRAPARPAS